MNLSYALSKLRPSQPAAKPTRINRLLTLVIAGLLAGVTPIHADTAANARQLVEMWAPDSVAVQNGTLTIVLPQDRITDQIYLSVIKFGLCMAPLRGLDLHEVENIEILNRHSAQGFVYERGISDCAEFNDRPANDRTTDIEIMGHTHWYP